MEVTHQKVLTKRSRMTCFRAVIPRVLHSRPHFVKVITNLVLVSIPLEGSIPPRDVQPESNNLPLTLLTALDIIQRTSQKRFRVIV